MEEDTTTEVPVENGAEEAQPVETEQTEAVETTEQPEEQTEEAAEPSEDGELEKFAAAKGLELDSENAKKAAKMAMNAEKLAGRQASRAGELEKATKITEEQLPEGMTSQQHDNVRMRNLELKFAVQEWKANNPEKAALESDMVKVLAENPTKLLLVQEGHLTLDDVYHIARGGNPNVESELKSQGKQEALQNLAQKQKAAVPRGNAVNTSTRAETITKENVNQLVAQNGQAWFEKNYEAINRAMAS